MTEPVGPSAALEARLEERARALGFTLFGLTDAAQSEHMRYYEEWLAEGRHGGMRYLEREDSIARRADLRGTMESVRSVVVVGHEYYQADDPHRISDPESAVIARYARGLDYHDVIKPRLLELLDWLDSEVEGGVRGRAYVDTGPILERDLARRAGLGWFGKNTMLIDPGRGSYFFLGVLLVDTLLVPSPPFEADRCGTCSSCLDACPTGALLGRGPDGAPVMDARRCISYLTIEHRGPIPPALRSDIGNRVFGCDICQEVCPWNGRFARASVEDAYRPRPDLDFPRLVGLADELLNMDDGAFRRRFSGSAVLRTRRRGMLRNICVGLGNALAVAAGDDAAAMVTVLSRALRDEEGLVRGHAAWALGKAHSPAARGALRGALESEDDPTVREEILGALDSLGAGEELQGQSPDPS